MKLIEGSTLLKFHTYETINTNINKLKFDLNGALITKSRRKKVGIACAVFKVGNHFEVHDVKEV